MIIWIDDDTNYALQPFIDEFLDNNFDINISRKIQDFWDLLYDNEDDIKCIIIDVVMPTLGVKNKSKTKTFKQFSDILVYNLVYWCKK